MQPEVKLIGFDNIIRRVGLWSADSPRALINAIKTEGFSLRATMAQAVRMSKPAPGEELKELSIIARVLNRKSGIRQHRPLLKLAGAITYLVDEAALAMRVGYTARSPYWSRRAATKQQSGFSIPVTPKMRGYFAARAEERRAKRTWKGRRLGNPLLLRKETTRLRVPARPIVVPFWNYQKHGSMDRIRRNFRMIMAGQVAPGGVLHSVQDMAQW